MLRRGVAQGSVLGPVLFCIYAIELSYVLQEHGVAFTLYADDTVLFVNNILDTESKLTRIMCDIKNWMDSKQLKLNENKSVFDHWQEM